MFSFIFSLTILYVAHLQKKKEKKIAYMNLQLLILVVWYNILQKLIKKLSHGRLKYGWHMKAMI